jgi:anti-sigma factor (TIGR02949 family)
MSGLSCEQVVELLMDFLKREVPPDVAAAVQHHLDECNPCDQHARFETRFVFIVSDRLGKDCCPERLKGKILDALAKEGGE